MIRRSLVESKLNLNLNKNTNDRNIEPQPNNDSYFCMR